MVCNIEGSGTSTPYSCLTDIEWDKNNNGLYADLADSIDFTQYFSLSRLSTKNVIEARKNINRIIEYEQNPDTVGWKNEILMCGNRLYSYYNINNEMVSDSQLKSEKIYSDYINTTGWNGTRYRFYDTATDHPNGANYNVVANNLQTELSKGYAFANVCTHGDVADWEMEDGLYYHTFHVDTLHAPRHTLIMTNACYTNNIKWPSLFLGGAFMNSQDAGIIGYYGCSEKSITYRGYVLGPGELFCAEAWKKIFSGTLQLGDAISESKDLYCPAFNDGYSDNRWLYLFMNLLGDPGLTVYSEVPKPIDNLQIAHRCNDISFSFDFDTKICVMSRFDHGNSYYGLLDYRSPYVFLLPPNEYMITATYPNSIPYRTIFSNVVYLQNESLNNNLNVDAEEAVIGSNVVSDRLQGPVVVENGSSMISTRYGTTIQNDFEVKMGASLEIKTNTNEIFNFY